MLAVFGLISRKEDGSHSIENETNLCAFNHTHDSISSEIRFSDKSASHQQFSEHQYDAIQPYSYSLGGAKLRTFGTYQRTTGRVNLALNLSQLHLSSPPYCLGLSCTLTLA